MIKLFALILIMTGRGKAIEQAGPFETMEMCEAAKILVVEKTRVYEGICIEISVPKESDDE